MMIISPLERTEYTNVVTNVSNDTDTILISDFTNVSNIVWSEGDKVSDGVDIYYATEEQVAQTYHQGDVFNLGDTVVYDDGVDVVFKYVSSTVGEVPDSPNMYPSNQVLRDDGTDLPFDPSTWDSERYIGIADDVVFPLVHSQVIGANYCIYTFMKSGENEIYYRVETYRSSDSVLLAYTDGRVPLTTKMSNLTTEPLATVHGTYGYFIPGYIYMDGDTMYMRSDEVTSTQVSSYREDIMFFSTVSDISEMPNLTFLMNDNKYRAIDDTNYSYAETVAGVFEYDIDITSVYDTVAIRVEGSNVTGTIQVLDSVSTVLETITISSGDIDCSIGNSVDTYYTTNVYYLSSTAPSDGSLSIRLSGCDRVSNLMVGNKIDAGFTNLKMKNGIKDFSILEYDPFGNASYVDRARVSTYLGRVDLPISDYDKTNRLMLSMGKQVRVIDGSDNTTNAAQDSVNVFSSTQIIGRFFDIDLENIIESDRIGDLATYSFTFEEIV